MASFEDVPHPVVPALKALRVDPVEPAHASDHVGFEGLHQKMVAVGHLALGLVRLVNLRARLTERIIEHLIVGIVQTDVFAFITRSGNMIQGGSEIRSQRLGHVD